ncbi:MAG TPA: fumarylacetoacetate hydrolase family protein [Capillimicrobium sp.]|nr:fumarylacetoacetate hydrolase family protein [Capillimicrobium sp.]
MSVWNDPRVASGMERQLQERRRRLEAGERPLGWKVAFGSPQAMANLGIEAPLVGFLTDAARVEDGAAYSVAGWTKGALEPEIAVHMGADLPAGSDRDAAAAAIAGLGPAFELADLDLPLDDLEAVVAGNIFQRGVVLGPVDAGRAGGDAAGLRAAVDRDGEPFAQTDSPLDMVGDLLDVTRHVADFLGAFGETLRAGDAIITGSVVPLIWLEGDGAYDYRLEPLGGLSIRITT